MMPPQDSEGEEVQTKVKTASKSQRGKRNKNRLKSQETQRDSQLGKQTEFPNRPALKFIPSPQLAHQLILQAVIDYDSTFQESTLARMLENKELFLKRKKSKQEGQEVSQ